MSTTLRSRVPLCALVAALAVAGACPATATPSDGKRPRPGIVATAPPKGELAVRFAVEEVGTPYRWGGESPATGFDCSGLVRWAYGRVGIDLPHSSYALYSVGRRVPDSALEPGDLLFFEGLGHVGLYLGKGRMVHAPQTGRDVEIVNLGSTGYGARMIGARRVAT